MDQAQEADSPGCCTSCWSGMPTRRTETTQGDTLVEELNALSVREREGVYNEIHGISNQSEETPELLDAAVKSLRNELGLIPKKKRHALDHAMFLKPTLMDDRAFMLMFLRADYFDTREAAIRMNKFFDFKLEVFGENKLAERITYEDLDEEDREVVDSGCVNTLAFKDSKGRPVWVWSSKAFDDKWSYRSIVSIKFVEVWMNKFLSDVFL